MKIISEKTPDVSVMAMKNGDIAIITDFLHQPEATGKIVQRYRDELVTLGKDSGHGWDTLLTLPPSQLSSYRVRILPVGTELVI